MKKIISIIDDFSYQVINHNVSSFAASTSFFLFLSLVPAVMIICSVLPYTPVTQDMLLSSLARFIPGTVFAFVTEIIESVYESTAGILSISIILTLWSAGKAMMALSLGFNAICDVEENRKYLVIRGVACLHTLVLLVGLIFTLVVEVFGRSILLTLYKYVPATKPFFSLILHGRHLITWLLVTVLIAVLYNVVPRRKSHFKSQLPGAILASTLWSLFSWAFSLYVRYANFTIYGSLAAIVIFMLWLYVNMNILMMGIYINTYLKPFRKSFRTARKRRKEEEDI
ncbi:MAG: YihY/virulence factor BrkB family protein [Lachnospiraceae bacterium]|nr:YihY/virulence factor BrkB family protein [Lachnospiraceae bacterium]